MSVYSRPRKIGILQLHGSGYIKRIADIITIVYVLRSWNGQPFIHMNDLLNSPKANSILFRLQYCLYWCVTRNAFYAIALQVVLVYRKCMARNTVGCEKHSSKNNSALHTSQFGGHLSFGLPRVHTRRAHLSHAHSFIGEYSYSYSLERSIKIHVEC